MILKRYIIPNFEIKKYLNEVEKSYFEGTSLKGAIEQASRSLSSNTQERISKWLMKNLS